MNIGAVAGVAALTEMRTTLVALAQACHAGRRPDCPILQGLAAPGFTGLAICPRWVNTDFAP